MWMFWTRLGLYLVSDSVAVLESALFVLHCHGISLSFPIICYVTDAHNYARTTHCAAENSSLNFVWKLTDNVVNKFREKNTNSLISSNFSNGSFIVILLFLAFDLDPIAINCGNYFGLQFYFLLHHIFFYLIFVL